MGVGVQVDSHRTASADTVYGQRRLAMLGTTVREFEFTGNLPVGKGYRWL